MLDRCSVSRLASPLHRARPLALAPHRFHIHNHDLIPIIHIQYPPQIFAEVKAHAEELESLRAAQEQRADAAEDRATQAAAAAADRAAAAAARADAEASAARGSARESEEHATAQVRVSAREI